VARRNLCPDLGDRTDDGPGHLDINCSDDHDQEEEILKVPSRQKEVEKVVHSSDQLSQTDIFATV
jgi:hypothetical protein